MSKNRRKGTRTEPLRLVRRGLRWAQRKIRWTTFPRLRERARLLVGLPGKGVKNTPFHSRCETPFRRDASTAEGSPALHPLIASAVLVQASHRIYVEKNYPEHNFVEKFQRNSSGTFFKKICSENLFQKFPIFLQKLQNGFPKRYNLFVA